MPIALLFGFVLVAAWILKNSAQAAQQCSEDQASAKVKGSSNGFAINNPGNIRYIAPPHAWQGQIANHNGYGQYDTLQNGVRAIGKQLSVDYNRGNNTIAKLISVWAPAADDNNTQAYIADVSQKVGIDPNADFTFQDALPDLAAAIIFHENGYNSIDESDLLAYLNS
jgi:hypothetical protein